jgi:hypothetical protein
MEQSAGEVRLPPPVPDGTMYLESLGRFLDNLLGDARMRRATARELETLWLRDEEVPEDPPPAEIPPAVSDGTDVFTEGQDEGQEESRGDRG